MHNDTYDIIHMILLCPSMDPASSRTSSKATHKIMASPALVQDDTVEGGEGTGAKGNQTELRGSCDRCWQKKRRCPGGKPCLRCRRGSFVCCYSAKKKLGRPSAGPGSGNNSRKKQPPSAAKQQQEHQQQQQQQHQQQEQEQPKQHKQSTSVAPKRKRKQQHLQQQAQHEAAAAKAAEALSVRGPSFCSSAATGLAGMAESQFLSCFLQHCAPM